MSYSFQRTATSPALAWESHGSGPAVVFVHGVGGNRSNWQDQIEGLSDHFQVVVLDLRGYGDSESIPGELQFNDFARDVLTVMDELKLSQAHLVGLSMGGLVVQAVYAMAPERVSSLVLAACRPGDAPVAEGEKFARDRLGPLDQPQPLEALADSLLPKLMGPSTPPHIVARLRDSLLRLRINDYRKIVAVRTSMAPLLKLADIQVPTLVMGGRNDALAPPEQMQALARGVANSELEMFENCGHFLNIEQAEAFNRRLRSFLQGVAANA